MNGLFAIDDTKDSDTDEYRETIDGNTKIDEVKVQALLKALSNAKISEEQTIEVLESNGFESIRDITIAKYKEICDKFKGMK